MRRYFLFIPIKKFNSYEEKLLEIYLQAIRKILDLL